jgi:hypothetical protein
VQVSAARRITFDGNSFINLGQVGLGIGNDANAHASGVGLGTNTIMVTNSVFTESSGGGIVVGGVQADAHHPSDPRMVNEDITISNNMIWDVAKDYRSMAGILNTYTTNADIRHNETWNLPYSGINLGYGWGTNDAGGNSAYVDRGLYKYQPIYNTPTTAKNNRIVGNRIHDVMQELADGACIYNLSANPGTRIDRNYCYGNNGYFGLYFDQGSRYLTAKHNVFQDTGPWVYMNANPGDPTGDLTLTDNWRATSTEEARYRNIDTNSRNIVVTGTVVVSDGQWPREAQEVIDSAGPESSL